MSRSLEEKEIVAENVGENVTSQESARGNDEGPTNPTRHGSITPTDEKKYEATQIVLRSTTDSEGYLASVSSTAEIRDGETGTSISPPQKRVNLFEIIYPWNSRQLKEMQYDSLKSYYIKLVGCTGSFNWYKRFGEISSKKPKMIDDLPCECDPEAECNISETTEKDCKGEDKPTKRESTAEHLLISIKSPIQQLAKHNITCNARRTSRYFSCIAEYFIEEEVDPDIFLYIPFPKEKNVEDSVDYEYYILQENRKILILKLWEGLRKKLESWVEGMTESDKFQYEYRNEVRIAKHLVLNNLLEDLLKPYENFTYREERKVKEQNANGSNQNSSILTDDQTGQDKCRYLLLKAEYESLKKRLNEEASKRCNEQSTDDAVRFDYYISYKEIQELTKEYTENDPTTSRDKNIEMEIEKKNETEQASHESESERKKGDSEQENGEQESKRKKGDSEEENEGPESKRKKGDIEEETEGPESKRKKGDIEEETDEPEGKRKKGDSEEETDEPEGKRKKGDSEEETEEPEVKRKRVTQK